MSDLGDYSLTKGGVGLRRAHFVAQPQPEYGALHASLSQSEKSAGMDMIPAIPT